MLLTDDREMSRKTENFSPYVLQEPKSNLFPRPGEWTVTCQAFCEFRLGGESSQELRLSFVVEQTNPENARFVVTRPTEDASDATEPTGGDSGPRGIFGGRINLNNTGSTVRTRGKMKMENRPSQTNRPK